MQHKPTIEQQAIIDFIKEKPTESLMVDARAGAAKTSTIEMAAEFIGPQFTPLSLAFNKRIAEELKSRLPPHFECLTLNGLGHRAWSAVRSGRLIVDADKSFKALKDIIPSDVNKAEPDLFKDALQLLRAAKGAGLVPAGSPMQVTGLVPDHPDTWEELYNGYVAPHPDAIGYARQALVRSIKDAFKNLIDFDDQLYMSVLFGGKYPKYHTVIVDEAQDLSPMNHRQLELCTGKRLIAVGDPYQAIYAFRGADSNSMTNLMDSFKFTRLGLTQSFRVPKLISARQNEHVPDFGSMPWLGDGKVEHWPKTLPGGGSILESADNWSVDDIPSDGFILCRNNAPLMKMAFTLIKARRPVKILGRDIGANLANLLDRICDKQDKPVDEAYTLVTAWETKELLKAGDSESKMDGIRDRAECLTVLLDASGKETTFECINFIKALFSDNAAKEGGLILSSGHKAKGLENFWVMHLNPELCPSKLAIKAAMKGDDGPLIQEKNLQYVIETRSKGTLIMASLEDCAEVE